MQGDKRYQNKKKGKKLISDLYHKSGKKQKRRRTVISAVCFALLVFFGSSQRMDELAEHAQQYILEPVGDSAADWLSDWAEACLPEDVAEALLELLGDGESQGGTGSTSGSTSDGTGSISGGSTSGGTGSASGGSTSGETGSTAVTITAPDGSSVSIPAYAGEPYIVINQNVPYFDAAVYGTEVFEVYSGLDQLGRCGMAFANIGRELMPTAERESISKVHPSGWQSDKYSFIDGAYLYNRCHLIGFQLTGENANTGNLITGTRYLNIEGMLPFENQVAEYIQNTGNHVLYRVTPVFVGENLVASGLRMEAQSVEDGGTGVCFHVYAYNVQPGVVINYATGENEAE